MTPEVTAADRETKEYYIRLSQHLQGRVTTLEADLAHLHGQPFSRRDYGAMAARLDAAEARVTALEDLVRRMRDAQRRYYKTRDQAVLIESKTLEREVDRALDGGTALL